MKYTVLLVSMLAVQCIAVTDVSRPLQTNPTNGAPLGLTNWVAWRESLALTNVHDIRAFGAVQGDGFDDTVAIQAAVDAGQSQAVTNAVWTVYIPPGRWTLSNSVLVTNLYLRIKGEGESSILDLYGDNGLLVGDGTLSADPDGEYYTGSRIHVEDLVFYAQSASVERAIWGRGMRSSELRNVYVDAPTSKSYTIAGIEVEWGWSDAFFNCRVLRCSGDAWRFSGLANNMSLTTCWAHSSDGVGFNFEGKLYGNTLTACWGETLGGQAVRFYSRFGNLQSGGGLKVAGGYFENCGRSMTNENRNMIEVNANGVEISGCLLNTWEARTNFACVGYSNAVGLTISGNYMIPFLESGSYGIIDRGGTNSDVSTVGNSIWVSQFGTKAGVLYSNAFVGAKYKGNSQVDGFLVVSNFAVSASGALPRYPIDVRIGASAITLPAGTASIVVDNYSGAATNHASLVLAGSGDSGYGTYSRILNRNRGSYSVLAFQTRDAIDAAWADRLTLDAQYGLATFAGDATVNGGDLNVVGSSPTALLDLSDSSSSGRIGVRSGGTNVAGLVGYGPDHANVGSLIAYSASPDSLIVLQPGYQERMRAQYGQPTLFTGGIKQDGYFVLDERYSNTVAGAYLPLTGGTLSGSLTLGSTLPTLTLNLTDPTSYSRLVASESGSPVAGIRVRGSQQASAGADTNSLYLYTESGMGPIILAAGGSESARAKTDGTFAIASAGTQAGYGLWDTRLTWGTGATNMARGSHDHAGVYEPVLGNPAVSGYVLSSTDAGVRSWTALPVAFPGFGTDHATAAYGDHDHGGVYAPLSHEHAGGDITSGTVAIERLPTGTSGTSVALGNHTHEGVYAHSVHYHTASDVTSGVFDIGRIPTGATSTTVSLGNHGHEISGVSGLQTALDGKAPTSHAHDALDVTSGVLPFTRGGTGNNGYNHMELLRFNGTNNQIESSGLTSTSWAAPDGWNAYGTWPIAITGDAGTVDGHNASDFEGALGNPAVSGYVLSSTDAGVRSWTPVSASGATNAIVKGGASGEVVASWIAQASGWGYMLIDAAATATYTAFTFGGGSAVHKFYDNGDATHNGFIQATSYIRSDDGFRVGAGNVGATEDIDVLVPGGATNRLHFVGGIYTGKTAL